MAIEWTPDYCLTCDHQCPAGAAYCSQSCRLADIESASCTSSNSSLKSATNYSLPTPSNGFYLPPPLNFAEYASNSPSSSFPHIKSSVASSTAATFSYNSSSTRVRSSLQSSGLYSFSSRASFNSTSSPYSQPESPCLSDKAIQELKDYANCFDQVRDLKRRMSIV